MQHSNCMHHPDPALQRPTLDGCLVGGVMTMIRKPASLFVSFFFFLLARERLEPGTFNMRVLYQLSYPHPLKSFYHITRLLWGNKALRIHQNEEIKWPKKLQHEMSNKNSIGCKAPLLITFHKSIVLWLLKGPKLSCPTLKGPNPCPPPPHTHTQ